MRLMDMVRDSAPPAPWALGDNIPWDDSEFSARMLREHLSQDHDLASRRDATIQQHVRWIHENLLGGGPARILDLCCGPGLYGVPLARLGCNYVGVDFSPASIEHARRISAAEGLACTYTQSDVRQVELGPGFDLVMMIYGEFNVFRPADIARILDKAHAALAPGGVLLLEPHTHEAVKRIGKAAPAWDSHEAGLFSDRPHLLLQRSHWDEATQAATRQYFALDAETADVTRWAASYQAYTDDQYRTLLSAHGFENVTLHRSLCGQPDPTQEALLVIVGRKADVD